MKKINLIFFLVFCFGHSKAQDSTLLEQRIPKWAFDVISRSEMMKSYEISDEINPFYLEADFNGDDEIDIALFIRDKYSDQNGF